jgi:hypothetical protein
MKVPLKEGWNLISLPVVPDNPIITTVMKSQIDDNTLGTVWAYVGNPGKPKSWLFFQPGKASTLKTMNDGVGYWVYMKANDALYVKGTVIPAGALPPSYQLDQGWNLIGFKSQPDANATKRVGQYLSSINGNYDPSNVWLYNSTSGLWIRADTDPNTGTVLHPGDAMWILMTSAATLNP